MNERLLDFVYLMYFINIVLIISFLAGYSGILLFFEIIIAFFTVIISLIFSIWLKTKEKNAYYYSLVFFALFAGHAVLLNIFTNSLNVLVLSVPNIFGLYLISSIIPLSEKTKEMPVTSKRDALKKELKGMTLEEPEVIIEEIKPAKKKIAEKKQEFIASKKSSIFHTKKCPRAKAIPKKNRIKFTSRFHAENQGFTPHECVE